MKRWPPDHLALGVFGTAAYLSTRGHDRRAWARRVAEPDTRFRRA